MVSCQTFIVEWNMSFTHLHVHTEYSLLDGLNRVKPLMEKVKNSGMSAVAISDHGVMYGATEFWLGAKEFGLKPIIGCEIYLAPGKHSYKQPIDGIKYYHLLLLAKNKIGYQNLSKIVSIGHLEGFYSKPRIDAETLAKYSEGLICTSACLAGPLARHIKRGEEKKVDYWLQYLQSTFKDNFYLEIQRNGFANSDVWHDDFAKGRTAEQIEMMQQQMLVNTRLRDLAADYKLPLITSTDAHFLNKEDNTTQEILFAIKDGRVLTDPKKREGYLDTYVKTPEEMLSNFQDIPEVLESTMRVAEGVEEYKLGFPQVQPRFLPTLPEQINVPAGEILRSEVFKGAESAYGGISKELEARLEYELKIIHDKGYDDYMLVVSDIIRWARSQGIVVGVRGSAAGSVVAYCLDIINVEPISWELYFERFLNPERPSPPDIDMDFQDDRRDEVIDYVKQKYGNENVSAICAIGRMKTKAAIRDVGRVMQIDLAVTDKLSKLVHVLFGKVKPIGKMMQDDPEFASIINSSSELLTLKDTVTKIEGMARHVSTHACGYLITPEPITNYVAVQFESAANATKDAEGNVRRKVVTQQEGTWLEELGLMKFDFLGLRNLTIIKNTIDLVEKYHGVKIDTKRIPFDDQKTFKLFGRGDTIGIFQFESPPMQKYLRDLQPETLEDICFMGAAYRPGPMQYIPGYIDCKHGRKQPEYLVPEMKTIVGKTYGFAIYQEQVIKIAVDIGGYTMGAADLLRRAMSKKKLDIMKKEEPIFKKGVMSKNYSQEIADKLWEYLLPFADYGFNKAHSASYALVSYWCAYLKANYPIEFMAGLMHSDITDTDRITIDMAEARKLGFTILPPDINKSESYFTIEKGSYIRFGLGAVKNVGLKVVQNITMEREKNGKFKHLDDFAKRMLPYKVNKKAIECLIKIGTMDKFGHRNQLLLALPVAFDQASKSLKSIAIGQVDMFSGMTKVNSDGSALQFDLTPLPVVADIDSSQKILWEKELIGSYITSHPLDKYQLLTLNGELHSISALGNMDSALQKFKLQQKYKYLGLIGSIKIILTKKDSKPMAILTIEDQISKVEAVVFPNTFLKLKDKLVDGQATIFFATLSQRDDRLNLIIDDVFPADNAEMQTEFRIDIRKEKDKDKLIQLKQQIKLSQDLTKTNEGKSLPMSKLTIVYGDDMSPKTIITTISPVAELVSLIQQYR